MPPPPPVLGQTLPSARNVSEANVHISNPNAVIHISTSRPGKHKPSMVDTYCLLFNAQGQLVEHMSHNPASIDGAITQVPRNQYGHDQKFIVALQYVNYGIDVVGFIISHSEDTVSDQSRPLDECSVQCVLHSSNVDVTLCQGQGDVLCEYAYSPHDPSGGLFRNATMVCKIYRDTRQRSHWVFNPIGEGMTCVSHCIVGLTRCAQLHLVDIIPDIDIPNVASLNSIQGICSALSSVEFLAFENKFPANGHDKRAFATCLCEGMVRSRPELRSEKRITALLSLLYEMFDQIDINGDCQVDWEEFTSFCVALGMISTKQSQLAEGKGVEYTYKQHPCHGSKTFPYHITRIKCFDAIRKVAVLEHMSPNISIFDFDGHFLHDKTSIAKSSVMKDGLYVIDIDHVPGKNCFVVSSSDRAITVWSIVNAVKGQYVQSGKVVNHDMMMVVKWCPMLKLCLLSSVKSTSLWNVDTCKVEHRLRHHSDLVTDVVEIPATRLFATCSFDHNVAVWEADRMKVLFQFTGHTQAVMHLDCNGNVLVSCGFEHHARVWSIATRKHLVMLTGHHYALLDVKLVRHHSAKLFCVTGDTSGHFKIWDISRCIVDASRDAAVVLHTYTVNVVGSMAPIFHSFAIIPERKRTTELLDIWAGNFQVLRLVPEMVTSLHSPLQFVLYNQVSHTFTASIAGRITVWSGKSGVIIQEPIAITSAEVCAMCFDLPRQRKLFIATSDGRVSMFNPITGLLMDSAQLHDGEVMSMIYCERTNCLITNGTDDSLSICNDVQGEGRLDPMRSIDNVHRAPMSACAYSSEHGLIATGDTNGHIRVHDFQRLSLIFRCDGHKGEVTALAFHRQCCVLFAGDSAGEVLVWQVLNVSTMSKCLMRLTSTAATPVSSLSSTFVTDVSPTAPTSCGISSLCMTEDSEHSFASVVAADDLGYVHCWPLQSIRQHFRGVMRIHFDPLAESMIAYARGGYNPNLRISRRQSVMAPPPPPPVASSTATQAATDQRSRGPRQKQPSQKGGNGRTPSPRVADALSWKAHDSKILQLCPLQFPGFLYSYDDVGVRLWDAEGGCLGTLQRRFDDAESQPMQWQYRPSILLVDNSATMKQMALDILTAAVADSNSSVVGMGDGDNAIPATMTGLETQDVTGILTASDPRTPRTMRRYASLASVMEKVKAFKVDDPGLGTVLEGLKAHAEADRAFSRMSVKAGVKENVFSQDEAYALEAVGRDALQRRNYETILFPPLLLTTAQIKKAYAKECASISEESAGDRPEQHASSTSTSSSRWSGVQDLPILRTCDNFAVEVAARRLKLATTGQSSRHEMSVEPSEFLKRHLQEIQPKKRSKRRPKRKIVRPRKNPQQEPQAGQVQQKPTMVMESYIKMTTVDDKSNVVLLPTLSKKPLKAAFIMQKSASMPVLHAVVTESKHDQDDDRTADKIIDNDAEEDVTTPLSSRPEIRPEVKENIRRKMVLCDSMCHETRVRKAMPSRVKVAKKRRPPIDPVEWAKAGKNPFGPHYSVREVLEFGETLLRFDKDLSGDIDTDEWMKIMTAFMPKAQDADVAVVKDLFATVDANEDGLISLNELLHIVVREDGIRWNSTCLIRRCKYIL
ncbi:hypothetical protein, variant [Aphanomyces astaci]|uniref:EF-hand domain-containing protein n=1 Tax=Aphanomyces astaci TaxID=112090 RepID=W4G8B4_APHAT|nr:hypothetical protein, variant [Aphanomyces astaci]ETV75178.1 hypothetical protein, variant [Aphanomyces astaci]|eukprot:XP_009835225.1 hypothetical protein, variant [Aphanomyces astaci]